MARVLFYGGCHAQALTRMFRAYCGNPAHSFEMLISFVLINKGEPFPYDYVKTFDVVVYSPVNRAGYNTKDLPQFLDENGIRHASYPWLAWHGYYPGISMGVSPAGVRSWYYPQLVSLASQFSDLGAFTRAVLANGDEMQPMRARVQSGLESTTSILKAAEQTHATDIVVSDFILANYRNSRLFVTPDHPTMVLYRHVIKQLSDRLGITLGGDFPFTGIDPQIGDKVPLLPFAYDDLGLLFRDSEYRQDEVFGKGRIFSLPEYLSHVFSRAHSGPVMRAVTPTVLKAVKADSWTLAPEQRRSIASGDILAAREVSDAGDHLHVADVALNGEMTFPSAYIYKPSWKMVA